MQRFYAHGSSSQLMGLYRLHTDCMAGLGEVGIHVSTLLFALEVKVCIRNAKTVTEGKTYWLLPSGLNKLDYRPVYAIRFTMQNLKCVFLMTK